MIHASIYILLLGPVVAGEIPVDIQPYFVLQLTVNSILSYGIRGIGLGWGLG